MGRLTARRPRLLFLCQTTPYPPDGGAQIRTYHVLRLLARAFDVTALCFERSRTTGPGAARDVATGAAALGRFAAVELFAIPQLHSRVRYAWDHLRSVALRRVYTTYLYDSRAFRRRLAQVLASQAFDLVHVDSLDLADYLPACGGIPVVCVHHDVEPVLLRRRAAIERRRWRRAYLEYQARLRERVEREWCRRVALNVVVSEQDRALVRRLAPASRVTVIPNGVDIEEFQPTGTRGSGLAFVGGTSPAPNLDALEFFCDEILPHLRRAGSPGPARWIGRASSPQRRYYAARHDVELTGYVEDVRPFMQEAACHIVPMRAGGGTRLKILNSWAMGKPVVSTSLGCEGLAAIDGENILIRDDPKDFARAVGAVLEDGDLGRRLGERGRETAERLYSWDVIGREMIDTYLTVANARSGVTAFASTRPESRYASPAGPATPSAVLSPPSLMSRETTLHRPRAARFASTIYYGSLRGLGLTALQRRFRDEGLILCYHNVVAAAEGGIGDPGLHLPRDRFERQMRWLRDHYEVVSLRALVDRLLAGSPLHSMAAVTFDDAYAGVFEHALPILHALGTPATVFVVAEAAGGRRGFWWDQPEIVESATPRRREKWLSEMRGDGDAIVAWDAAAATGKLPASHRPADWAAVRAGIERGIDLGVHSATHRSLPTLSDVELEYEVVASRATVHRATGIRPEFFAYPYGRWDPRVRELIRRAGYRAALTLDAGRNGALADPWSLRRVNVPAGISDTAFEAWAAGFHGRRSA